MEEMYQENILDHYRNPVNFGHIENPDIKFRDLNPLCGDAIEVTIRVCKKNIIEDMKFEGSGCAISMASADIVSGFLKGKSLDEVEKIGRQDVLDMLGIEISYVRLKCAMLILKVVKTGVYSFLGQKLDTDF